MGPPCPEDRAGMLSLGKRTLGCSPGFCMPKAGVGCVSVCWHPPRAGGPGDALVLLLSLPFPAPGGLELPGPVPLGGGVRLLEWSLRGGCPVLLVLQLSSPCPKPLPAHPWHLWVPWECPAPSGLNVTFRSRTFTAVVFGGKKANNC